MVEAYLAADIAKGVAEFQGHEVDVAIAVLIHQESGQVVWQHNIAVPFIVEDWLERVVAHLSTLKHQMEVYWPEVAVHVDWWLKEPGDDPDWPHGLSA